MSSPARPVTKLDKTEILDGLFASWDDIDRLMADVPAADWHKPSPLPGWYVRDVLAHIIGTESMMAGVRTPEADIDVSELEHVRNGIGQLNESWVRHLSTEDAAAMLERYRDITAQRRAALTAALSEADWDAVTSTPAGQDSYGRFMRIRTFDCWMHEQDIRHGLGRPPSDADLAGPAAQRALDEVGASMAFVVGKLGKAPDGSRVALELTGPLARTIRVAVDGRAALADDFGAEAPTTTVTLDGLQFTQLCGGRPMFENRSEAIEYGGDDEVGRRVVANLNYVI